MSLKVQNNHVFVLSNSINNTIYYIHGRPIFFSETFTKNDLRIKKKKYDGKDIFATDLNTFRALNSRNNISY